MLRHYGGARTSVWLRSVKLFYFQLQWSWDGFILYRVNLCVHRTRTSWEQSDSKARVKEKLGRYKLTTVVAKYGDFLRRYNNVLTNILNAACGRIVSHHICDTTHVLVAVT